MKYKIVKLDGRWSYRKYFEYAIIFSNRMNAWNGPLNFTEAQKHFFDTYGWSAEIRQWADIKTYLSNIFRYVGNGPAPVMPECVNQYWSWTNGYDDLRIYVASDKELTFFRLTFPEDQSR
jgi:hypothetical protein